MERSRVVVTKAGVSSSDRRFDHKRCAIFVGGDGSNACFSAASYLRPPRHQHMNSQQQDHHLGGGGGGGSTVVNGRNSTELSIFDAHKYFNELCSTQNAQKDVAVCGDDDECDDVSTVVPSRSSWASSSVVDHDCNNSSMGRNVYRARSFHVPAAVTPTASSEASWNSQTGLLSNPPGAIAVSPTQHQYQKNIETREHQTTPSTTSKPAWFRFPRRCPCSGKKSVQIESQKSLQPNGATPPPPPARRETHDNMEMNKKETLSSSSLSSSLSVALPPRDHDHPYNVWGGQGRPRRNWEPQVTINTVAPAVAAVKEPSKLPMGVPFIKDKVHTTTTTTASTGFSFPILKLNGGATTSSSTTNSLPDPRRNSLEVFGGQSLRTSSSKQSSTISTIQKPNIEDEVDVASDTSSDLFEIESFSTSTTTSGAMMDQYSHRSRSNSLDDENMRRLGANVGMYSRPRSSLDNHQHNKPMEYYYYEPSEASVDWSVTTAEGFDRAPLEHADPYCTAKHEHDDHEVEKMSKLRNSSGNNYGLLSCRWEKAVSTVGPNPVKVIMPAAEGQDAVGPRPPHHPPPSSKISCTTKHVESRPPLPKNNKLPRLGR